MSKYRRNAPVGFIRKPMVADLLGIGIRSVDNYMRRGLIPYYKFGRKVFFKEEEILKALNSCRVPERQNTAAVARDIIPDALHCN